MKDGRIFVVMGVSGCGKSTMARLLASASGGNWIDADSFHSEANKAKMHAGLPLTDEDRQPWLERLNQELRAWAGTDGPLFMACSALKQRYRDTLAEGLSVTFVYLKGTFELLRARVEHRQGHFMPASLLQSQFDAMEEPRDAIVLDISRSEEQMVADFQDATRGD